MMPPSPLEDPVKARHAWRRYRRLMAGMFGFTTVMVIIALSMFYAEFGMISIHFYIATALGIFAAMLLMSALMGLVFLSNGTGHDDVIVNPVDEDQDQ